MERERKDGKHALSGGPSGSLYGSELASEPSPLNMTSFEDNFAEANSLNPSVSRSLGVSQAQGLGLHDDLLYRSSLGQLDRFDSFNDMAGGLSTKSPLSLNPKDRLINAPSCASYSAAHYPEPPEVPGGYLEPSYHSYTRAQPMSILNVVLQKLGTLNVDFSVKKSKFKVKCTHYVQGAQLLFVVRVFTVQSPDLNKRYVFEGQRRKGCVITFSNIYRQLEAALREAQMLEKVPASENEESISDSILSSSLHFQLPDFDLSLPPEFVEEPTVEQQQNTVRCLLDMAASTFSDVKAEAVRSLAQLTLPSAGEATHDVLVKGGGLECFIKDLSHEHEDVYRNALTGLANLTHQRADVCRLVRDYGALKPVCTALCYSGVREVARSCAHLMANMGLALGKAVMDKDYNLALDHLSGSSDPRTLRHTATVLEHLHNNQ